MLAWDTAFFGFPIAPVRGSLLTPERCEQIDQQCRTANVRCLYFSATPEDATTLALAHEHGFRMVDVKMTLQRPVDESSLSSLIFGRTGPANEEDLPALEHIAATSHRSTRFFYDGGFAVERCEELYRTWIRNCVRQTNGVLVVESDGEIAGYSACSAPREEIGIISLIAVGDAFRGQRIGVELVNASLAWCAKRTARIVSVTTQGWNVAGQRVYQQCGFRTSLVQLYYHKWFD